MFVEFLIAFLPVFTFFLCLLQLALLFAVKLVTEHAAINAARAAAVIIGDEKKPYANEPINKLRIGGSRYSAIYGAALLTLSPFILDGTVEALALEFPAPDAPGGKARTGTIDYAPMSYSNVSKVRVRVVVTANCKIGLANRIACGSLSNPFTGLLGLKPTQQIRAEAVFPFQGARYEYPP